MSRFCIDKSVIGTEKHIIVENDNFIWAESVPRDAWHMTGQYKSQRCLDSLIALSHRSSTKIPEKYILAMSSVLSSSMLTTSIPWQHAMPQKAFRIFFKTLIQETSSIFPELPFSYYNIAWAAGTDVLSSLKSAKINEEEFARVSSIQTQNSTVVESFNPGRTGYAKRPEYDRFKTRTGRLTVTSGPNILVLDKNFRKIIKSSFDSGTICYLDFRALEARIVLAENGKHAGPGDMYEEIAKQLFDNEITRDIVKTSVISELYGISRSTLKSKLKTTDKKLDAFIGKIKEHFGIEQLKKRLKEEASIAEKIKNRFGRPLLVNASQDNLLINTYAQSSGVDVAMLGFDRILKKLGTEGVRPLFVLHDAIILDVRQDRLDDVKSCASVEIPTYDCQFPLKFEIIV